VFRASMGLFKSNRTESGFEKGIPLPPTLVKLRNCGINPLKINGKIGFQDPERAAKRQRNVPHFPVLTTYVPVFPKKTGTYGRKEA
jgi:hypothetical protein